MKDCYNLINQFLTDRELSEILNITERSVYNWKKSNKLSEKVIALSDFLKEVKKFNKRAFLKAVKLDSSNWEVEYNKIILRGRVSAREASKNILRGENWKISFFNFFDSFNNTLATDLIKDPPVDGNPEEIEALFASTVCFICRKEGLSIPQWARVKRNLRTPWFVSGMEKLRFFELTESPVEFKRNNIFITTDFLKRV